MDIEADDTLVQISKGVRAANGGIALIAGVQRQHGESLETIIRLVTPEQGAPKDGPSLEELIGALLARLGSPPMRDHNLVAATYLTGDPSGEGTALRRNVQALYRNALLSRIFDRERIASLLTACQVAARAEETA